jgi:hypothetical protein
MKKKQSTAARPVPLQGPTLQVGLPLDVLVPVALRLPQRYRVRLGCVCRQLHQLTLADLLWAWFTLSGRKSSLDLRPSRWMDRVVVFDQFVNPWQEPDCVGPLDVPEDVLARHNSLRFV